jgi:hypothetical protein
MEGDDEIRRVAEIKRLREVLAIDRPAKKPGSATRRWDLQQERAREDLRLLTLGFKPLWWFDDVPEWCAPPHDWFERQFE